ncbi:MAG: alpha/beta hydrolase [Gemmatimonadota bacterium]
MSIVRSKDGTQIGYEKTGTGPLLILVDGALCSRANGPMAALALPLAREFTVIRYDRRGRGESGDTAPYAVAREVEDIEALINAAGDRASVYGLSSGAALALEAAAAGLPIMRLALYEPPFIVDDSRPPMPADYVARLNQLLAEDRRGDMVAMFMRSVEVPAFFVGLMRLMPVWKKLTAVANTLPYDLTILSGNQAGKPLSPDRWAAVTISTLVMDGGKSPPWMRHSAAALAQVLPNAQRRTLPGQNHMIGAAALAPTLLEFFR